MNWGEIPQEMTDAAAQVRKAQANLEKLVQEEINRRSYNWKLKLATVLRERESLRAHLRGALQCAPGAIESALTLLAEDDSFWFPGTTPTDYIEKLENS